MRVAGTPSHPISARIVVGFAAALAILVAIGVDSYRSALGVAENSRMLAHTHEVLSTLSALYADILAVESARRGYILAGDEAQAERARTTANSVRSRVPELRRLTADNLRQQSLLDRLEPLIVRRLAQIEESIEGRRQNPNDREVQSAATIAGTLTREIIEALRPATEGRVVEWKVDGLPEVSGDRALLRIVFNNLLGNAVKYTRPRPPVVGEIGWATGSTGEIVVFVKDNGIGFDMHYADMLFGVFQRLHRSEEFEGTGIGLATVRRIIRRHGGRTWAEASVDGGATFYVALPARAQENA